MIVRRRDPAVISFDCNWDVRKIATEATLELICSPFEFRAGDVLLLDGFGPGSSGSTATPPLPGRWLVSDISRDRYALSSRVTLVQPTKPGKEPAHDREWKEADESSGPSSEIYTDAGGVWVGEFQSSNNFGEPNHGSPPHVHHGLDVSVPSGTKCIAPFDGTVVHTSTSGFGVAGGMFLMQTNRNQAGLSKGDKVGWGHVSECKFKPGDHVKKGQVVAISNGNPPHVHFVLQKKNGGTLHDFGIDGNADPSAFLRAIGSIPGGAAGYTKGAGKPD
jgi:murein DD-endopeptidase MepM/ murein hydrolase activator NlpD